MGGQKWKAESGRSGETGLKDKDMNRHLGTLGNMESEGNEMQINTTRNLASAANLMTTFTGIVKTKPDLGSLHPLRYGGDSAGEILNFSGKKQAETSKHQTMGRKVRKGTTETGPLPVLGKLKQRQTSLPAKKKGNGKDKPSSSKQGDKKTNTTGGPQSMILGNFLH